MIKIKSIELSIFLIYLALILLEIKQFIIWGQISNVFVVNDSIANFQIISNILGTGHPHLLRLLLVLPFYVVSDYLSLNLNIFFSSVLLGIIFICYIIIVSILKNIVQRKYLIYTLIFFLILSFFMNGRSVFPIFGNTLLLYLLYNKFYIQNQLNFFKFLLLFFLALWSVSVSSGTFSVFLLTIFIFYTLQILIQLPTLKKNILWFLSFSFMLVILILPILLIFINKNLDYYDDSFINMLSHGLGRYLIDYFYIILPLLAILILLIPLVLQYLKKYKLLILPLSMIIASNIIGLFGLLSFISGISAYLLYIYMYINKKKLKKVQYV